MRRDREITKPMVVLPPARRLAWTHASEPCDSVLYSASMRAASSMNVTGVCGAGIRMRFEVARVLGATRIGGAKRVKLRRYRIRRRPRQAARPAHAHRFAPAAVEQRNANPDRVYMRR